MTVSQLNMPWVEKYRPKRVDDIAAQEEVVRVLSGCLQQSDMPHLLFYGPPGTGKTSTALAVAHQLFGPNYRQRVMELNASDERGIGVVRSKVKTFASFAVGQASTATGPRFKLIILDEADSMTQDAQTALRRTMEQYSSVTRFVFICNYVSRIIDPLASRCAKFRFKPLQGHVVRDHLWGIAKQEGVTLTDDVMTTLEELCGGDLRRAITLMQSAFCLDGPQLRSETICDEAADMPEDALKPLLDACRKGRFRDLQSHVEECRRQGYPAQLLLSKLQHVLLQDEATSDDVKAAMCIRVSSADKALVDGSNELLQLLACLGNLQRDFKHGVKRPF